MSEFNGFLGSLKQSEPTDAEKEKQFFCGILAFLCNRPSESFETFSALSKNDAAAAFNCALCFLAADDYERALEFLEDAEKQLHCFERTAPSQKETSSLLQYESRNTGYRLPMLPDTPKVSPERALKQVWRVKADVFYALGQKEELKKLFPLLSGENYENIEKIKKEMRN